MPHWHEQLSRSPAISQDEEALGEAEAIYRLAIAALSGNRTRIELRKLCDEHTALRRRSSPESQLDADH